MRLLYLSGDPGIPVLGEKGASIHVRALASCFAELGHELTLASPRLEPGSGRLPANVRLAEIPAVRPVECATHEDVQEQVARQSQAVIELARRERVQAIYERYSLTGCAGARAATALGLPLALEVNAPLREEERRFRRLAHESAAIAAEQEAFAAAGRIFAVSSTLAAWLSSLGVEPERVEVMENAPPARTFAPKPALASDDQIVVGFAGGLKPWHGIETLALGFERALERGARMRLEIVGRGPAEVILDQAGLPLERVTRRGHLPHDEALAALEAWDVGLAPYPVFEGFYFSPLKLVEYMAAGLCPVVSDVGELAQTVEHGRAGVVVRPGDADALAAALLALDRDRVRLRALGERARAAALRRPSWRHNAAHVLETLAHLRATVSAGVLDREA